MKDLYQALLKKCKGRRRTVKTTINGFKFEIKADPAYDAPKISINFFLPKKRYSRKDLFLSPAGELEESNGFIPQFDLVDPEPKFEQTNEELLRLAVRKLLK